MPTEKVVWNTRSPLNIRVVERILLYHAVGAEGERRLAVAVICQALVDARLGDSRAKRCALEFLKTDRLNPWARMIEIRPEFIREFAQLAKYI